MVHGDAGGMAPVCTPPHDIPGQAVKSYLPTGPGSDEVLKLMLRGEEILEAHPINDVRRDLGENPATSIWLWGQGRPPSLPTFSDLFGIRGATIAAVDLIRGLARCMGMSVIDVPGATGYLDTNYAGKGAAALRALDEYDLVVVHVESPDEAGHLGDAAEKVNAIEQVDRHVVAPLLDRLRGLERWRIAVVPDHPTPVGTRIHSADPPPFCMAGTRIESREDRPFGERNAAAADLHISEGHTWMEYFLRID
jgi:2,3-bisphosphoglycerate-independent phosphoglycerate mutase